MGVSPSPSTAQLHHRCVCPHCHCPSLKDSVGFNRGWQLSRLSVGDVGLLSSHPFLLLKIRGRRKKRKAKQSKQGPACPAARLGTRAVGSTQQSAAFRFTFLPEPDKIFVNKIFSLRDRNAKNHLNCGNLEFTQAKRLFIWAF